MSEDKIDPQLENMDELLRKAASRPLTLPGGDQGTEDFPCDGHVVPRQHDNTQGNGTRGQEVLRLDEPDRVGWH